MKLAVRCGVIVLFVAVSAGCESSVPTAPTAANQVPLISPAPPTATNFPPLSGPSRTFVFDRELSHRVSDYTRKSRFVLYENGAFVLQYPSLGEAGYRGAYTQENSVLRLEWEGWSTAGPWGATGTLNGDSLTVRYNVIMQATDFEDAVYVVSAEE